MRFLVDTSIVIAAVTTWHQQRAAAIGELERRLAGGDEMMIAGHTLAEAYAVLTRLPAPHRLSLADATRVIEINFVEHAHVIALSADGYRSLLQDALTLGIAGGQMYDLVIAQTARGADVGVILTFNREHFQRMPGLEVVVPS